MKRAHLLISGHVQGVWFRESTKAEAEARGLVGWVRNLVDGRVEAVAEGAEGPLAAWVAWCHDGPSNARVDKVEVQTMDATGEFSAFRVER